MEFKISTGNKELLKSYVLYGVIGAGVGLATGLMIKNKPVLFTIGGFLIGGYVGHVITQSKQESKNKVKKSNFQNFSINNNSTTNKKSDGNE